MTHLTQTTQLNGFLTSFSVAPSPGAGAEAREEAGLLACFMLPKSSGYLGGQPWYTPRSKCCGEPLRGPKCWVPALPAQQGPHLLQLLGAALAECPSACEVLPEGVPPGKPPPDSCCGVHQGGGLPFRLIRQGHQGQALGHPPAGTGSLTLVLNGGWPGARRLTLWAGDTSCLG